MNYFSVIIPPLTPENAWMRTEWHSPTTTLARGAFATRVEADNWALAHLGVAPYTIKEYES